MPCVDPAQLRDAAARSRRRLDTDDGAVAESRVRRRGFDTSSRSRSSSTVQRRSESSRSLSTDTVRNRSGRSDRNRDRHVLSLGRRPGEPIQPVQRVEEHGLDVQTTWECPTQHVARVVRRADVGQERFDDSVGDPRIDQRAVGCHSHDDVGIGGTRGPDHPGQHVLLAAPQDPDSLGGSSFDDRVVAGCDRGCDDDLVKRVALRAAGGSPGRASAVRRGPQHLPGETCRAHAGLHDTDALHRGCRECPAQGFSKSHHVTSSQPSDRPRMPSSISRSSGNSSR